MKKKPTTITVQAVRLDRQDQYNALMQLNAKQLKTLLRDMGIPIPKYKDTMADRLIEASVKIDLTIKVTTPARA